MKYLRHVEEIVRDAEGLWISGLFSAIHGWNPEISFSEHKESFFFLLELLLRAGKIKFIAPGADCYLSAANPNPRFTIYDDEAHWKISPDSIVAELRSLWPQNATDQNDPDLTAYFYFMPGVIWVAEDGTLSAS